MDTSNAIETSDPHKTCEWCEHENVPGAKFCARCGQSLDDEDAAEAHGDEDQTQVTKAYRPIGAASPEATWGEPEIEQTTALPIQDATWSEPPPPLPAPHRQESPRGLVLGILATLLILAVLALYIYAAWLGEAARDDIASWLPW